MTPSPFTESQLRNLVSPKIFARGQAYFQQGVVLSLIQRGPALEAEVQGAEHQPYQVYLTFDDHGLDEIKCTCPYDGPICKHTIAVLLTYLHKPEQIEAAALLSDLLQGLTQQQLYDLILVLAKRDARLRAQLETEVTCLKQISAAGTTSKSVRAAPPIDTKAIRRQLRNGDIEPLLHQVERLLAANDSTTALQLLEIITDEQVHAVDSQREEGYYDYYEEEDSDYLLELDNLWTIALLQTTLTEDDKTYWYDTLTAWGDELDHYGMNCLTTAVDALHYHWHYPPVKLLLQGKQVKNLPADALVNTEVFRTMLTLLKAQGRIQEYLHLAKAVKLTDLYLLMLIEQGQIDTAVQLGLQELTDYSDTLTIAQKLVDTGHPTAALQLAKHTLSVVPAPQTFPQDQPGGVSNRLLVARHPTINGWANQHLPALPDYDSKLLKLADWTYELAKELEPPTALQAALLACRQLPEVERYQRVQTIAGNNWHRYRQKLLKELNKQHPGSHGYIEILLHEDMVKEAIKQIDSPRYTNTNLLTQVMAAALQVQPDWVIKTAKQLAEEIINGGRANHYDEAVAWLTQVQRAYQTSHRLAEWQTYYTGLRTLHQRKRKLMELLNKAFAV